MVLFPIAKAQENPLDFLISSNDIQLISDNQGKSINILATIGMSGSYNGQEIIVSFYDKTEGAEYKIGTVSVTYNSEQYQLPLANIDWIPSGYGGKHTIIVKIDNEDGNMENNTAFIDINLPAEYKYLKPGETATFDNLLIGPYFSGNVSFELIEPYEPFDPLKKKPYSREGLQYSFSTVQDGKVSLTFTTFSNAPCGKYALKMLATDGTITRIRMLYLIISDFVWKRINVTNINEAKVLDLPLEEGDYKVAFSPFMEVGEITSNGNQSIFTIEAKDRTTGQYLKVDPVNDSKIELHKSDFTLSSYPTTFELGFTTRSLNGHKFDLFLNWLGNGNVGVAGDIVVYTPRGVVSFDAEQNMANIDNKEKYYTLPMSEYGGSLWDKSFFSLFKYQNQIVVRRDKERNKMTGEEVGNGVVDGPFDINNESISDNNYNLLTDYIDEYGDSTTFTCEYLSALAWKLASTVDPDVKLKEELRQGLIALHNAQVVANADVPADKPEEKGIVPRFMVLHSENNTTNLKPYVPPIQKGTDPTSSTVSKDVYTALFLLYGVIDDIYKKHPEFIQEGIVKKSDFDKEFSDTGKAIFDWLMQNGYLERISDTEGRLISVTDELITALKEKYPDSFQKVLAILQQSLIYKNMQDDAYNIVKNLITHDFQIKGKLSGIGEKQIAYQDPTKPIDFSSISTNTPVTRYQFSDHGSESSAIFLTLIEKGYIDPIPDIPSSDVGSVNPNFTGVDDEFKSRYPDQYLQIEDVLFRAYVNINYLFSNLQNSGYIDVNHIIQDKFINLYYSSEMSLARNFEFKRQQIYDIMRGTLKYMLSGITKHTRLAYVNFNPYKRLEELADLYEGNVDELVAKFKDTKKTLDDVRDYLDYKYWNGVVRKNLIKTMLHGAGADDLESVFDWAAIGDGRRIDVLRDFIQYFINRFSAPDFPTTANADEIFKVLQEGFAFKSSGVTITDLIREVFQIYHERIPRILGCCGEPNEITMTIDFTGDVLTGISACLNLIIGGPIGGIVTAGFGTTVGAILINKYENQFINDADTFISKYSWYLNAINEYMKYIDIDKINSLSDIKIDSAQSLLTLHILKVASQIVPSDKTINNMTLNEIYRKNLEDIDSKRLLYTAFNLRETKSSFAQTLHEGDGKVDAAQNNTNHLQWFALLNLIRLENDPSVRDKFHTIFDEKYVFVRDEYNSLYDFLNNFIGKQYRSKADLRDGFWSLYLYDENNKAKQMDRKGIQLQNDVDWERLNRNVIQDSLGGSLTLDKSLYPVPLDIRPSDTFVWQRNARNLSSDIKKIYPPLDFFFVYWLQKYYEKNDYYFTDPTFIQKNRKDLNAFKDFMKAQSNIPN